MRLSIFFASLVFVLFSCGTSSNVFPKKHLGAYHGVQEAYTVNVNGEKIEVPSAEYEVILGENQLWMTTPKQKIQGTYEIKAQTDMYYTFIVELETGVKEEWRFWKEGQKLIRTPISPQPELIFLK